MLAAVGCAAQNPAASELDISRFVSSNRCTFSTARRLWVTSRLFGPLFKFPIQPNVIPRNKQPPRLNSYASATDGHFHRLRAGKKQGRKTG